MNEAVDVFKKNIKNSERAIKSYIYNDRLESLKKVLIFYLIRKITIESDVDKVLDYAEGSFPSIKHLISKRSIIKEWKEKKVFGHYKELKRERHIICVEEQLYIYNNITGVYEVIENNFGNKLIYDKFQYIEKKDVESIWNLLKSKSLIDSKELNKFQNFGKICVQNGLLNLDTLTLEKAKKKDYATICLGVEYRGSATCPRWESFLDETFTLYADEKEKAINLLRDFMYYSLVEGNERHKMLLITGKPRTGKSVISYIITQLLGENNTTSYNFSELSDLRAIPDLKNKLANIVGEMSNDKVRETAKLKSIVGEDKIAGRKLYQNYIQIMNKAKLIAVGNFLPSFQDDSGAMEKRVLVLELNNVVNNQNPRLREELSRELSGILNWVIRGKDHFEKYPNFDPPALSKEILNKIKVNSNTVAEIIEDYREKFNKLGEENQTITFSEFKSKYREICKDRFMKTIPDLRIREICNELEGVRVYMCSSKKQYMMDISKITVENETTKEIEEVQENYIEYLYKAKNIKVPLNSTLSVERLEEHNSRLNEIQVGLQKQLEKKLRPDRKYFAEKQLSDVKEKIDKLNNYMTISVG